jgi:Arc/MetJ-type ribon-helix-helix transcriptional regulator
MKTVTLSLPDSLATQLEQNLASNGYEDVSEYVTDVLRAQQAEHEALKDLLLEGLRSCEPTPATADFWAGFHADTDALLTAYHQDQNKASAA